MKKIVLYYLTGLHIIIFISYFYDFPFLSNNPDEGVFLTGAQRIVDGQIPHKDFFYIKAPGEIYLLALFFISLSKTYHTAKLMMFLLTLFSGIFLGIIINKYLKDPVVASFCTLSYFSILLSKLDVTHHLLSMFFVVFAMCLLGFNLPFLSGLFSGITFLFHEPRGLFLFSFYAIFLLLRYNKTSILQKKYRNFLLFISGGLTSAILFFIFLLYSNSFLDYFYNMTHLIINYKFSDSYPFLYSEIHYIKLMLVEKHYLIPVLFILLVSLLFFLPIALLIITIKKFLSPIGINEKLQIEFLTILGLTYFASLVSELHRLDSFHIIFYPAPMTIPFIFVCLFTMIKNRYHNFTKIYNLITILLLVTFSVVGFNKLRTAMFSPKCEIHTHKEIIYSSSTYICNVFNELGKTISEKKDKTYFIYHWSPILYFLFDLKNPTSFDMYKPIYNSPAQINKLLIELSSNPPEYIIKDFYIENIKNPSNVVYWFFPKLDRKKLDDDPADKYIKKNYRIERNLGTFLIFKKE